LRVCVCVWHVRVCLLRGEREREEREKGESLCVRARVCG
jgi:hypothetical protein